MALRGWSRLGPTDREWFELITDFNAEFVSELKSSVPAYHRRWDPRERSWRIGSRYRRPVLWLCRRYFAAVDDVEFEAYRSEAPQIESPYRTLHLLPSAPWEVIRAAHKALARLHHPDRGGSHETMVAINTAYETIKGERA